VTEKLKIMLVDDDDVDRMTVRRALQQSGLDFDLTEAVNGAAALAACGEHKFDCVFLDYRLPDADGDTILAAMVADYDSQAAVVFLTGQDDEGLALKMMGSGAVDYLTKGEISATVLKRAVLYATARQNFHKQLSEMARIDVLTGLPNRSVFETVLTKAIAQATRAGSLVAVTILDLDNFKDVNDTLWHPAGDALLKMTAERLSARGRVTDTVMRLGGDEFAIIAPNLADARGASRHAQKIIDALAEPFRIEEHDLHVSTSAGIALAPMDGADPSKLLKSADMALYKAKADGRGRYHFYDEKMNAAAQDQRVLESELRVALEQNQFELFYQPKIDILTGQVLGTESLIRWNQPGRGLILPDAFIPAAEKAQLIVEIGDWVLQETCRQNVAWQKSGIPPLNCSINLSPHQLKDSHLISSIDKALEQSNLEYGCLEIEITESAILDNIKSISALLGMLRMRGVSVSIDDFGTGYSSLTHLKQLPVDKLKIDRSFVSNLPGSGGGDAAITNAAISLGHTFGLKVIAEGVEEQSQLDYLQREGCDQAQGYFMSRPRPADEFAAWYRQCDGGRHVESAA
jgi:diguanylate cyclase (GGDEF)-like protein